MWDDDNMIGQNWSVMGIINSQVVKLAFIGGLIE